MRSSPPIAPQAADPCADSTAAAGLSGTVTTAAPDSLAMITRDAFVVVDLVEHETDVGPGEGVEPIEVPVVPT